jgi:predicted component of type VI protein secretion system
MPYLEFEYQKRAIGPGVLTIGSGAEAGWRIFDHDLVPLHAIVTVERDGRLSVERGAPNAALFVNGAEVEGDRGLLRFGDTVRLGSADFRYLQHAHETGAAHEGYLHDTRRGRLYKLGGVTEIGRDIKCAVVVQEPEVSRIHAEVLHLEAEKFIAKPVGSAYTLINTHRLGEPTVLREGDELTVGRTVFRFTTDRPSNAVDASGRPALANKRAAMMQTMFIGTIEAQERLRKSSQRKYGAIFAVIAAVVAIISFLLAR